MTEERKISDQDLASLLASKSRMLNAQLTAQKAATEAQKFAYEAQVAQLQYQNFGHMLFIKYKLELTDTIIGDTGVIVTLEEKLAAEQAKTQAELTPVEPVAEEPVAEEPVADKTEE